MTPVHSEQAETTGGSDEEAVEFWNPYEENGELNHKPNKLGR